MVRRVQQTKAEVMKLSREIGQLQQALRESLDDASDAEMAHHARILAHKHEAKPDSFSPSF